MVGKLFVSIGVIAVTAQPVLAAGINLGWNDCPGGGTYSTVETFACDTNDGEHTLVGSVVVGCCISAANGNEMVIDLQTAGASLSNWWRMGSFTPGACPGRTTTPGSSFDFTSGPFTCFDFWAGRALGGIGYFNYGGPNRARIKLVCAVATEQAGPIASGTEAYSFKVTISNEKTVGADACTGCTEGACIVLNSIRITQNVGAPGGDKFYSNPATNNAVAWQGGLGTESCLLATPARDRTWGQIKALYR